MMKRHLNGHATIEKLSPSAARRLDGGALVHHEGNEVEGE